ncbi:crossover junction endonuclease EME1B isoform X1 [Spinacia oleracea]|uniref:Crossover junction endonuclease EME1B isoform X1 n=1 Tax=Spinacia oleracea TaxID=3562 RepID=A0A9R0IC18_SPIOL|nr:crossover junction endonuclease EME1B isoform X1 [Spinacia oleracea]
MSQPEPIVLSDSDDDDEYKLKEIHSTTPISILSKEIHLTTPISNFNKEIDLITPISNKRPRKVPVLIDLIDDPTPPPPKLQKSASSTKSFIPETPIFVDDSPVTKFTANLPSPSNSPALISSGVDKSDNDAGDSEMGTCVKNMQASPSSDSENESVREFDLESWLDIDSTFCLHKGEESNVHMEGRGLGKKCSMENGRTLSELNVEQNLEKRPKVVEKENCQENERIPVTSNVKTLEKCPIVQSTCCLGNLKSTKTHDHTSLEYNTNQVQPINDHDCGKENVRLKKGGAIHKPKSGGDANAKKKLNKDDQAADRKKLMEEKRALKEQEKSLKADLRAEAAKQKQLEKEKKKLENYKFNEKDIVAEIDPKVLSGSLGGRPGPLLTMFNEKGLNYKINPNPVEKSIIWRFILPENTFQHSAVKPDIRYILLIYDDAEEFCNRANDGSLMVHISSVRKRYPSYTICCLTNRLMSFINKREQQKYKKQKVASDWIRPPVEELFAKLTTQFANVHSRQCVDEAEVAEHVVGLTINLAKGQSRKKLTHLSVNANGCNVTRDCVDRSLIMKHPWLKALVSIPKVQPRFAIAIWKKYPTMKSLLRVFMDPTKTVDDKELLLQDLPLEQISGGEKRLGVICSKRVYRILMAQNGSITTDDAANGADYFPSQ